MSHDRPGIDPVKSSGQAPYKIPYDLTEILHDRPGIDPVNSKPNVVVRYHTRSHTISLRSCMTDLGLIP